MQDRRKELGCEFTDRIQLGVVTDSTDLRAALDSHAEYLKGETLTVELIFEPIAGVDPVELKAGGHIAELYLKVADHNG